MARSQLALLSALLIATAPVIAAAESADPFQAAPGPAPEAAKPAPRQHAPAAAPARAPERVVIQRVIQRVVVPEPAPAHPVQPAPTPPAMAAAPAVASPPAAAAEGVRQFAAARGVPLQGDIQVQRGGANRLLGVWGGQWGGRGRHVVLAVESLDANGRAIVVYAHSGPTAATWNQKPAGSWRKSAQLQGNALEWTSNDGTQFKFSLTNENQLFGELRHNGEHNSSGYFTRLQ